MVGWQGGSKRPSNSFFPLKLAGFYTELSSALAAQKPSALAVGRVLFAKSPENDPAAGCALMVARSVGVDSPNRALRLKERRKLETESAGRQTGTEEGRERARAAAIHFPDGREIPAFRCGRRVATEPRNDNDGRAGGRRRPGRDREEGGRGRREDAAIGARYPRCLPPPRHCDFVSGLKKSPTQCGHSTKPAVQFMARALSRHEWRAQPSRHAHARENYLRSVRPNFSWQRRATTHCEFEFMFEMVWLLCTYPAGIPH